MIIDLGVYLAVFATTAFMASRYQKLYNSLRLKNNYEVNNRISGLLLIITSSIFLSPIIIMFALRYGIGTDYFNYELIYNAVNNVSFNKFWELHKHGARFYYVELGYYLLNILFPNFRTLLWGIAILQFGLVMVALCNYSTSISYAFGIFIYLCVLFVFSMNGMRFALALSFVLVGYVELINNRTRHFVISILLASLIHKTSLLCLMMFFLKRFRRKDIDSFRDNVLFCSILLFPFIAGIGLKIASGLSFFERYFNTARYSASESMGSGWKWVLHIIPVILPMLIVCKNEIMKEEDTKVLFRICLTEIPLRMMGLYSTFYTRLSRFSQISQVIFIPLVLSRIDNRQKRRLLYFYYFLWYIAYFAYYAVVNDQGDSLPYVWIFSR